MAQLPFTLLETNIAHGKSTCFMVNTPSKIVHGYVRYRWRYHVLAYVSPVLPFGDCAMYFNHGVHLNGRKVTIKMMLFLDQFFPPTHPHQTRFQIMS